MANNVKPIYFWVANFMLSYRFSHFFTFFPRFSHRSDPYQACKLAVVARRDLQMSAGKLAAQVRGARYSLWCHQIWVGKCQLVKGMSHIFPWKHHLEIFRVDFRLPCLIISQTIICMNLNININQSTSSLSVSFGYIGTQTININLSNWSPSFIEGYSTNFYNQGGSAASHGQLPLVETEPLGMSHSYSLMK